MNNTLVNRENIGLFSHWLSGEGRSAGTIQKYVRDLQNLGVWLNGQEISKEMLNAWKEQLIAEKYEPVTVNSMLAAVNTFCRFMELNIRVKFLRIQKKLFRDEKKELNKTEYARLINTAEKKGDRRLALLIETIGATGIRVSEVQYITVQAAKTGRTQIALKGKIRDILLPGKLCKKLLKFYRVTRDVAKFADILGHSSIDPPESICYPPAWSI